MERVVAPDELLAVLERRRRVARAGAGRGGGRGRAEAAGGGRGGHGSPAAAAGGAKARHAWHRGAGVEPPSLWTSRIPPPTPLCPLSARRALSRGSGKQNSKSGLPRYGAVGPKVEVAHGLATLEGSNPPRGRPPNAWGAQRTGATASNKGVASRRQPRCRASGREALLAGFCGNFAMRWNARHCRAALLSGGGSGTRRRRGEGERRRWRAGRTPPRRRRWGFMLRT